MLLIGKYGGMVEAWAETKAGWCTALINGHKDPAVVAPDAPVRLLLNGVLVH